MDPYAVFGVQEYNTTPSRKAIPGEPSREKEQSHQYSPRTPSLPSSPRDSPREYPPAADYKKRKRGRPPLEKDSRLCTNCGTAETPEWRKGPLGPHTLCNACGLQWMKAQKRENESRSKIEEARKKNSVMRVLNSHGHSSSASRELSELARSSSGSQVGLVELDTSGELSNRYSPEMDTLPPDVSPTISPMQTIQQAPLTVDAINTLKAMQTLSALSHMNQLNHINTLNHLSVLSMNNNNLNPNDAPLTTPPPSHYPHGGHTVINHYNTNLNTYNNTYNLPTDMATASMQRYPPMNPQVFLPMYNSYNAMESPPPSQTPSYSQYGLQSSPIKDYTMNVHPLTTPHLSTPTPAYYPHYPPQVHTHSHAHLVSHPSPSSANTLLYPNPQNLIPNPITHHTNSPDHEDEEDDDETSSITGGGQM